MSKITRVMFFNKRNKMGSLMFSHKLSKWYKVYPRIPSIHRPSGFLRWVTDI